jgi:hypothetical protein
VHQVLATAYMSHSSCPEDWQAAHNQIQMRYTHQGAHVHMPAEQLSRWMVSTQHFYKFKYYHHGQV